MDREIFRAFVKEAGTRLKTKPKEHQQRVIDRLKKSDGVIVAHRLGGGKTFTSIAAAAQTGLPLEVVAPAPLVANYEKEIKKHVKGSLPRTVRSYSKSSRDAAAGLKMLNPEALVVLDEAHRLRNVGTKAHKHIAIPARKGKKRLLLTGTSVYNNPADLAVLANIASGEPRLPENPKDFAAKFLSEEKISPGLMKRLMGVKPGVKYRLKNEESLRKALAGHVDIYDGSDADYPDRVDETVNVPMSSKQLETHQTMLGKAPWHISAKIRAGLPPSKSEARQLNAFTTAARQASLSPRPYIRNMSDEEEKKETPKIQEAAKRLEEMAKADKNFRGVVYSNYLQAGLEPYARALKEKGIAHSVFTGGVSKKEKSRMIQEYNEGKTPVMLVSSSGTEGLDLKGTKLIQVMEPHWNNSKINQVIGRGIRFKSHEHLPPEERKVRVQRYMSTLPQGKLSKLLGIKPGYSTEQWIQQRADEKSEVADQLKAVMMRAHDDK